MDNKKKKKFEKIMIVCLIIIMIELGIMAIMKIVRERKIDRINEVKDVIKIDDGYITVGISDFHKSKFINEKYYDYTNTVSKEKMSIITTQARIAKYSNSKELIWENTFENKYDGTFYDVLEVDDGYIAVGSFVKEYKQIDANTRDALIVKYDKNGKMLWNNTYSVLSDTEFYKVIQDEDKYIVIGQSIYENMEMGTHTIGGGIIVSYDSEGNELSHNNYGGNKSGIFNDIIKVDDGYIVCGKDAANYGIVVKFSKDFNRDENDTSLISRKVLWERTYANTDTFGFTSMALIDRNLYLMGAVNISNEKNDKGDTIFKYDAGFVVYNIDGKYLDKFELGEDVHHRITSVLYDGNFLYMSMLLDVDTYYDGGKRNSVILKYDLNDKKVIDRITFEGNNNFVINKLENIDNKKMYIGTSNNHCTFRGCDYENIFEYFE